jgi:hypothetical protein
LLARYVDKSPPTPGENLINTRKISAKWNLIAHFYNLHDSSDFHIDHSIRVEL